MAKRASDMVAAGQTTKFLAAADYIVRVLRDSRDYVISVANLRKAVGPWMAIDTDNYAAAPQARYHTPAAPGDLATNTVGTWSAGAKTAGEVWRPSTDNGYLYEVEVGDTDSSAPDFASNTTVGETWTHEGVTWRTHRPNVLSMSADLSSWLTKGTPLRWTDMNGTRYGRVFYCDANYLVVDGPGFDYGTSLTELCYGWQSQAQVLRFTIPGNYGGSVRDLLANVASRYATWQHGPAKLVTFRVKHKTDAGTTQPYIVPKISSNLPSLANAAKGVQPSTSWKAHVLSANGVYWGDVDPTKYGLACGSVLEIRCTAAEVGTSASDLTVEAVAVFV